MSVKASVHCDKTSMVTIFYITSSIRFISLSPELDIQVLINLFKRNIILHDVQLKLNSFFYGRKFATVNPTEFLAFGKNIIHDYHPESPLDEIPTGRNPHWMESLPESNVSLVNQDSGESPPDF